LEKLSRRREQRRSRRAKTGIPILSIIGYTNAGKSTLFNLLTKSQLEVENKLFSTLDTATRRLRYPKTHKVVITDTVGFIKDLPKDLIGAFRPTFDELKESNLLIHLIDISHPRFSEQMTSVEKILFELKLDHLPRLLVFNKEDKLNLEEREAICRKYGGVSISALQPESLEKLFLAIDRKLWEVGTTRDRESYSPDELGNVRLTNEDSFDISNQN
jgi:GTP-binding protein HflX